MPDESVDCCVTSPPYYGLRDYGVESQIGREASLEEYINRLLETFSELKRVLKKEGTFWLNIADSYCGTGSKGKYSDPKNPKGRMGQSISVTYNVSDCKRKDLIGIPWLLAFSLRSAGWYLRSDIIWQKGNAMPESVRDRPSKCYEHIFLLTKSSKYYYDQAAIAEPIAESTAVRYRYGRRQSNKYANGIPGQNIQFINKYKKSDDINESDIKLFRNCRDVWNINTVAYRGKHYAAYPPALAERCILAGCPKGGIVIDPFFGSGTTGFAALKNDRRYIGIELNKEYCILAKERIKAAL